MCKDVQELLLSLFYCQLPQVVLFKVSLNLLHPVILGLLSEECGRQGILEVLNHQLLAEAVILGSENLPPELDLDDEGSEEGDVLIVAQTFEEVLLYVVHPHLVEEEVKGLLWQSLHILVDVQGAKDSLFHEEDGGCVLRVDPVLLHGLPLSSDGLLSQELARLEALLIGILLSGLP